VSGVAAGQTSGRPHDGASAAAWTEGDQAELDVLAHELARLAVPHRAACPDCQARRPCQRLTEAIEVIVEHRDTLVLRRRLTLLERARVAEEIEAVQQQLAQLERARRESEAA
jgi:hypothetical protein